MQKIFVSPMNVKYQFKFDFSDIISNYENLVEITGSKSKKLERLIIELDKQLYSIDEILSDYKNIYNKFMHERRICSRIDKFEEIQLCKPMKNDNVDYILYKKFVVIMK
jgi:hypothetical protein